MNGSVAAVGSPNTNPTKNLDFEVDVLAGLNSVAKRLPPKYFYDAEGSALFERITRVPEYYVTRSEIGIFNGNSLGISSLFSSNCAMIDLGAGSTRKSRILLGATRSIAAYVPVDIHGDFIQAELAKLGNDFPHLAIHPIVCDFTNFFVCLKKSRAGISRRCLANDPFW